MKDLTYMELLAGSKLGKSSQSIAKQRNNDASDHTNQLSPNTYYNQKLREYQSNKTSNQNTDVKDFQGKEQFQTPLSMPNDDLYQDSLEKYENQPQMTLKELQNNSSPQQQKQKKSYLDNSNIHNGSSFSPFRNQNNQQSPISNRVNESQLDDNLKPISSIHFDGVKTLYQQEMEILKYNIMQCQQQDKSIVPTFDQKENRLWESFSQSPSPNRNQDLSAQNIDNQYLREESNSPKRLKDVSRPENILKNEIYMMMLKSSQKNLDQSQSNNNNQNLNNMQRSNDFKSSNFEGSSWLTYSKNQNENTFQSPQSQFKMTITDKYSSGIQPYQPNQYQSPKFDENRNISDIKERDLESEDSKFKAIADDDIERLRKENEELRKNLSNMLDHSKAKGVSFKNHDQSTVHYYDKGSPSIVSNPFVKNQYNSAYIESQPDGNSHMLSNQQIYQQNPINYVNSREEQFSNLINANDEQIISMMKEDEEYEKQLRLIQEQENRSPYKKLSYHDQLKKFRKERIDEESQMKLTEQKRDQLHQGILKKQINQDRSHLNTALKKGLAANLFKNSIQKHMRNSLAYLRRISKYDIDRNQVDLYKLNKEKERDRKENVKIKKDALEFNKYDQKRQEVVQTKIKIEQLSNVKERQEKDRREFVRKQQDMFRKAIEDRQKVDKNLQYLSPNRASKQSKSGSVNRTLQHSRQPSRPESVMQEKRDSSMHSQRRKLVTKLDFQFRSITILHLQ
eukprot:403371643